ncbi:Uncharacterized protein pbN1_13730 [Aromatoleum bremense]|nr:Uncharacterized protein pbN1_13730 [Aromatoleum bremense]
MTHRSPDIRTRAIAACSALLGHSSPALPGSSSHPSPARPDHEPS